jgi:hypothetical protein
MEIPYRRESVQLGLDNVDLIHPKKVSANENEIIEKCLDDLNDFLDEKVLYIVNDNQRTTRTEAILKRIDLKPEDRIIIASGSHDPPDRSWIKKYSEPTHMLSFTMQKTRILPILGKHPLATISILIARSPTVKKSS